MKKLVLFLMVTCLAFVLGACNDPSDTTFQSTGGAFVRSVKVHSITFIKKDSEVVFTWGSGAQTALLTEDQSGDWPGKSLPLSEANDPPTLEALTNYEKILVDTIVLDRNGDAFVETGKEPFSYYNTGESKNDQALPFFVLVTDNSNWTTYETVKRYDMKLYGETEVDQDSNEVTDTAKKWSGTPSHIAFMARYDANQPDDEVVGHIILKRITFVKAGDNFLYLPTDDGAEGVIPDGGDNYPGFEIDLTAYLDGKTIGDISQYSSVKVEATLYSDTNYTTKSKYQMETDDGGNTSLANLAQFMLITESGAWSNPVGGTAYSMNIDGFTTLTVANDASGTPTKLVIQANYEDYRPK